VSFITFYPDIEFGIILFLKRVFIYYEKNIST
jgi:hypothetical protein